MTTSAGQSDASRVHGSQFFITLADELEYLDGTHTIIGQVEEGFDVLDKLAEIDVDKNLRPYRVIRIRHTIILHDPFDDPTGLPQHCPSPEPIQTVPEDRLASDEEVDEDADDEERAKRLRELQDEREARSRAEVLEMIGDIGDADMKPPDNVLFICKLNPVTQPEDLEIIFSRFGNCSADILRDKETGDSLCYGFIEFENKQQCERAFFKMENAVIDDRRVLVDFSQSVSKLWNATRRSQRNAKTDRVVTKSPAPHQVPEYVHLETASPRKKTDETDVVKDANKEKATWEVRKKRRKAGSRFGNAA
ncbi:Peptidyl-prolyl cis-trans isomerase [Gracilaria domingensis]|nr:Peptidyl-prolyl cis-trans isomerase [Gracilaria domingensis]